MHLEKGAVLLEVIAALTILSIAGIATFGMAAESIRAVRLAREAELEIEAASAFLDAVSLWPREELDLRLGSRPQGPWLLRIDRPAPTLYTVELVDTASERTLLSTALFRRVSPRAQQ